MNSSAAELHIAAFSEYLFTPEEIWSVFDIGDRVRFRKQVGLISTSVIYRIEAIDHQTMDNFRMRLSYEGLPRRIPLIIDRCDVVFAGLRHL